MKKVMILGGSGMLGHQLWLNYCDRFDTSITFRQTPRRSITDRISNHVRIFDGVSVSDPDSITRTLIQVRPDVVINCIGIVKQDPAAKDHYSSIAVNSLFPHRLALQCRLAGVRLIHLSTDCVFSGYKGSYSEFDVPDALDLYGRTKWLGEVTGENCLTIRTSIVGREISGSQGLIEWFLSQNGKRVKGFRRAVFSGFTTSALGEILAEVITKHPDLNGLWHVAAAPISKLDLLLLARRTYGLDIEIEPDDDFICDRSLDGSRFREVTGLMAPTWPEMIDSLYESNAMYEEIRSIDAER